MTKSKGNAIWCLYWKHKQQYHVTLFSSIHFYIAPFITDCLPGYFLNRGAIPKLTPVYYWMYEALWGWCFSHFCITFLFLGNVLCWSGFSSCLKVSVLQTESPPNQGGPLGSCSARPVICGLEVLWDLNALDAAIPQFKWPTWYSDSFISYDCFWWPVFCSNLSTEFLHQVIVQV